MATQIDIQVRDGVMTITVGASQNTGDSGADSDLGPCCTPVVIGPLVISGGLTDAGSLGGSGKNSGTGTGGSGKNSGTGTGGSGMNSGTGTGGSGKNSGTGTGGDGPGSGGCCAPVVIGPIVISGCSGQGDPPSGTDPQAVCVDPPLQSESARKPLGSFTMQTQEALNWCWAAVAVSINDFLDPAAAPTWTQVTLANKLLGITGPGCGLDPGGIVCNQPESLATALTITGNLRLNGALASQYLTFICIQSWINAQLPVAARIKWRGKGAHFIALDGYKVLTSGQQMVHVQDPSPNASPGFLDYDFLVEDYKDNGYWIDTFLVTA
jgi:hypothetical protein